MKRISIDEMQIRIKKIEMFVMESKKFEKFAFWSIIVFYGYILFHVAFWIGRSLFG